MEFSNTITIDRSRHDVFEFLADLENVPKWNYAIVETRKTSDEPVHVGTTYRQVRSLPSRSEETLQVTELEPDRRFAVHGSLGPFVGTLTYELEDVRGSTRVTNKADLEARGIKGSQRRSSLVAFVRQLEQISRSSSNSSRARGRDSGGAAPDRGGPLDPRPTHSERSSAESAHPALNGWCTVPRSMTRFLRATPDPACCPRWPHGQSGSARAEGKRVRHAASLDTSRRCTRDGRVSRAEHPAVAHATARYGGRGARLDRDLA